MGTDGEFLVDDDGAFVLEDDGTFDICEDCCGGCTEADTCGTGPNYDPAMCVTNSWTDMDVTKSLYGSTWTNGETKRFCPDNYSCVGGNSYELWTDLQAAQGDIAFQAIAGFGGKVHHVLFARQARYTTFLFVKKSTFAGTTSSSSKVSSHNIDFSGLDLNQAFISSEFFGSITWTDGVTTSWVQHGDFWNTCSNS